MIALLPAALLLVQASVPDSPDPASTSAFLSAVEAWSTVLLTAAILGVLVALFGVLHQLRGLTRSFETVARRLERDAAPVLDRARSIAENMEFITSAVRTDVQKLNDSIHRLNDRLKQASDRMEERIQDFSALVEVLQEEAEDLALDTAAAVRGVRAGTRSLANGGRRGSGESLALTDSGEPEGLPYPSGEGSGTEE